MRLLLDEYAQAVAARACALHVSIAAGYAPGHKAPLLVEAERREAAARLAVDDAIAHAVNLLGQSIGEVESIAVAAPMMYADDPKVTEGYRANFERAHNARRPFTLKDAKPRARVAARYLREAWEVLDPPLASFTEK